MPNYKGHLAGGLMAYAVGVYALYSCCPSFIIAAEWLLCALAGALFPDVDVKSKGQKYFYWVVVALLILIAINRRYDLLFVVSLFSILPMLVRHRGIFHQLWFIVAVAVIAWCMSVAYMPTMGNRLMYDLIFFLAGAISHLWLDLGWRRVLVP